MNSISMMKKVGKGTGWVILALGLSGWTGLGIPEKESTQRSRPWHQDGSNMHEIQAYRAYKRVVDQTVAMTRNSTAKHLAAKYGLNILNVTWEDTGRYKGSSVGPNISDMTIQVQQRNPRTGAYSLACMPVIRHPNFSDHSADIPMDKLYLLAGNQSGRPLKRVSLRKFLGNMRQYMSNSDSWKGTTHSLLAPRDSHVLVSAQSAFLPIPKDGEAQFNPVLFNYQSRRNNPAVLTILATREGTSVTVIDNSRDAFKAGRTWGQRLFFNQNGERASLTGKRKSDYVEKNSVVTRRHGRRYKGNKAGVKPKEGLNMVMMIQVPLKQRPKRRRLFSQDMMGLSQASPSVSMEKKSKSAKSDVEVAIIGHGEVEGPYTEVDNLAIERDPRFPIRVTVQFYKATSNGIVSEADMAEVAAEIDRVYDDADYVGSLVVDGPTVRPTEYQGNKSQPKSWWKSFWWRQHHKG